MRTWLALGVLTAAVVGGAAPAAAHTESDLVAVPAGSTSTVTLKPTHGCGESPTVAVRVRAPVPDARAEEVDGWTATSTPDGDGRTVLEWTGGPLPVDETGAFPVEFTVPEAPGTLLTFPAIQVCESGEELAWISGDPADEYPAPRLLVLPAGFEPAATIDDVPLDAQGRDQLVAIVDVDNPSVTPTTAAPPTAAPTTAAPTTASPTSAAPATTAASALPTSVPPGTEPLATDAPATSDAPATTAVEGDGGGGSSAPFVVGGVLLVAAAVVAAVVIARRRRPG